MITNKQKAYLIVSLTFVLGVAVGAAGQYLLFNRPSPTQSRTVPEVTTELNNVLHLDVAQRAQIEQYLNEAQTQYQALRTQNRPQFNAVRDATRKRIREVLMLDQQTRFDQWTRELDERRERERKAAEQPKK